jgi:hypothetical protein
MRRQHRSSAVHPQHGCELGLNKYAHPRMLRTLLVSELTGKQGATLPARINLAVELAAGILVISIPTYVALFRRLSELISVRSKFLWRSFRKQEQEGARDVELAAQGNDHDTWTKLEDDAWVPITRPQPVGYRFADTKRDEGCPFRNDG